VHRRPSRGWDSAEVDQWIAERPQIPLIHCRQRCLQLTRADETFSNETHRMPIFMEDARARALRNAVAASCLDQSLRWILASQ
jgi:hypothetical protein